MLRPPKAKSSGRTQGRSLVPRANHRPTRVSRGPNSSWNGSLIRLGDWVSVSFRSTGRNTPAGQLSCCFPSLPLPAPSPRLPCNSPWSPHTAAADRVTPLIYKHMLPRPGRGCAKVPAVRPRFLPPSTVPGEGMSPPSNGKRVVLSALRALQRNVQTRCDSRSIPPTKHRLGTARVLTGKIPEPLPDPWRDCMGGRRYIGTWGELPQK